MNKREIILDFTSLLDVVMLILFFFVLFSHFETNEMQTELRKQQNVLQTEYEQLNSDIQYKLDEANKKYEQATKYLEEVKLSNNRAGENTEGIYEFVSGKSLKIKLNMKDNNYTLDVYCNEDLIAEIPRSETSIMKNALVDVLRKRGYNSNDTILCEFFYNGKESGTASAYRETHRIFDDIKSNYSHLYISESDISLFEEE